MKKRILAVEDSPTQAEALRALLERSDYDVWIATSGEGGLSEFEAREYDAVISDIVMPGSIDGYELCRRIKASSHRDTPVVLLTSLGDPMDIIKGLESGADNFFTKPYDEGHLLERLQVLLDTKRVRRQSRMQMGVKVFFMGREFTISSDREQILDLLISTFEDAVRQNRELRQREAELEAARSELARYAGTLELDLERFFDLSIDMIAVLGSDGRFKRLNAAWTRSLGWTTAELMAERYVSFIHPQDRDDLRLVSAGDSGLQTRFRCKDGTYRALEWRSIEIPGEELLFAIARDVTDRNRLEEQFRQAQKMDSIGRLAGGVAHDFNNLLSVIIGETELVLQQMGDDPGSREGLEQVRNAARRAAGLTRQLLAFSRQEIVQPTVLRINDVVAETDKMLVRLIGEDVDHRLSVSPNAGAVFMDRGQLEQVLMNLAVNARDAMPEGGQLTIETANVVLDDHYVARHASAQPGDYVMLAVSDSGTGMTAEVQQHLFEPFFTTKERGKGTGLGLATCYGIVKQAGGHIEVYSEPGLGTTFKVYLPRVHEDGLASSEGAAQPDLPRGSETILLVEDDVAVRRVAKRMLEGQGYHVLQAGDADEALRILDAKRVDLLLTDLVLPGMSGRGLSDLARERQPGLPVLFASGYTGDVTVRNRLIEQRSALIQKPFSLQVLATKVREVLRGGP